MFCYDINVIHNKIGNKNILNYSKIAVQFTDIQFQFFFDLTSGGC